MPATSVASVGPASDLITLREAAELGYGSYQTLRSRIKAGRLPAVRITNRLYVRPEDVRALATPAQPMQPVGLRPEVRDWINFTLLAAPALSADEARAVVSILSARVPSAVSESTR